MSWGFEEGKVYNRRTDIHARFGGQQQGGIITPLPRRTLARSRKYQQYLEKVHENEGHSAKSESREG
jgi:hypothetical protein